MRDVEWGWSARLDPRRSMIDVHNLVMKQWDYLVDIVDARMMLAYQEYFFSHPFPWFTNPLRMVAPRP